MKKNIKLFLIIAIFILLPTATFAQFCGDGLCDLSVEDPVSCSIDCGTGSVGGVGGGSGGGLSNTKCPATITNIGGFICKLNEILGQILPLLVSLGVVYFVFGVVQYFIGNSEEAKKKGRDRIIYGIIGLVVIIGLWGLVAIVAKTFSLQNVQAPKVVINGSSGTCSLGQSPKLGNLVDYITCLINRSIIPLIFALAVVMFVWGVVQYVINADNEEKRKKGKQFIIWGVISLVVMLGVWGLVKIVGGTFGINTSVLPQASPR